MSIGLLIKLIITVGILDGLKEHTFISCQRMGDIWLNCWTGVWIRDSPLQLTSKSCAIKLESK